MITIKKLDAVTLIEDACALLYKIYVKEYIWNFSLNNPSRLRVEIKKNRKLLLDRFTENAIWFGGFYNRQLIGCTRLTFVDENKKLEVESYNNSSVIQNYLPSDKCYCAESSRTAVSKSYNGYGISRFLLLAAFKYCEENKYSVIGTSWNEYIIKLFNQIEYPLKMKNAFKYEEQDHLPVNFYFADFEKSQVKNMILNLEENINSIQQRKTQIEFAL